MTLNALMLTCFAYALLAPASTIKTSLLPGKTTHGHYQIEMDCDACHDPSADGGSTGSAGPVMQDACNRCHAEQLRLANDTHPASKFNDPTNADRLLILNAQDCLTCHQEHVSEQTLEMGLTLPVDYCWHCHDDIGETRPSHRQMSFDSCATAGCHNYHDNRALYEKYLDTHFGEPDLLASTVLPLRGRPGEEKRAGEGPLAMEIGQADGPRDRQIDPRISIDWAETAHAAAGVNCSDCHRPGGGEHPWDDAVSMQTCDSCHARQVETFVTGRHGMRLSRGLSPMTPAMARLPMHADAAHRELTCNACHAGHRFDATAAAVDACRQCHADAHTRAYADSSHAELWRQEQQGLLSVGSGVSCATCHLPRMTTDDGVVWVNHDQNASLRPVEAMARDVCQHCHGLDFALSSLADSESIDNCYGRAPSVRTESVTMAKEWFDQQRAKRDRRQNAP